MGVDWYQGATGWKQATRDSELRPWHTAVSTDLHLAFHTESWDLSLCVLSSYAMELYFLKKIKLVTAISSTFFFQCGQLAYYLQIVLKKLLKEMCGPSIK